MKIIVNRSGNLVTLSEQKDVTVPAGGSVYLPSESGVDISKYRYKTISFYGDYTGLTYSVEVSDDGSFTDYPALYEGTLDADTLESPTFEADFKYVRVKVENPDTEDHLIKTFRVKGR